MQLETTFRGLTTEESRSAIYMLEKCTARFERLLEDPTTLRAVVDKGPEIRVTMTLNTRGTEINASASGHDISNAVSEACDKVKAQLVRHRHRREALRHRETAA
jgi:ribosomal subunit interface protein